MKVTEILVFLGIAAVASATSFTNVNFSFDTQTINGHTVTGLSSGATSSQIQSYMNSVLTYAGCTGCTVTVLTGTLTNGNTAGAVADQTYNGDNNVIGPGTGSKSLTLGDTNGATQSNTNSTVNSSYDTFIANTNDSSGQISQQITIQFSGFTGLGLTVNSFDYEIFPDATCTSLTNSSLCGGTGFPNKPDLMLEAGNNTNGTDSLVSSFGTGGVQYGVSPGSANFNSTSAPCSASGTCDGHSSGDSTVNSPQYIGTWTAGISNVTELDFIDWPATIGLDNINITWDAPGSSVPEPVSVILLGTAVAGLVLRKKFRKA